MKDIEIISFYNNLDQYAKDKIDRQLIDLTNAKKESKNYCIKICPKCGAVNPGFTKGGNANSGKPMLKCSCCHKRFTYDNGQLTHYSHQDESKWEQLTVDTVVSGEIELDEKYVLNSHKGEKIDNLKPRQRGGAASKRGLSSEQICLPTAVQRNGTAVLKATDAAAPTSGDLMKLSDKIAESSMTWIDGKTAYNNLLSTKHCEIRAMKDHTTYTSIDHLNNVNAFHRLIEKWYKGYNGVASKYINIYAVLFTLVREYTGCDTQEILLSIKKRMHQISLY